MWFFFLMVFTNEQYLDITSQFLFLSLFVALVNTHRIMSLQIPGLNLPDYNLANNSLVGSLFRPIERGLVQIGLNTPSKRLGGFGVATAGIMWIMKPSAFFDANGDPKGWSILASEGETQQYGGNLVPVTWWLASILIGAATAIFL